MDTFLIFLWAFFNGYADDGCRIGIAMIPRYRTARYDSLVNAMNIHSCINCVYMINGMPKVCNALHTVIEPSYHPNKCPDWDNGLAVVVDK